jgi:uncharacterized protein (DUF302 family)
MQTKFRTIISLIAAAVGGGLLMLLTVWFSAPAMMIKEDVSKYEFEEAVTRLEEEALRQGWKIPTVHNLQEVMRNFGKDVLEVKVFELCHPEHAWEILSRDKERMVTSLMPCRVSIYKTSDGKTWVSRMNTSLMGSMMPGVVPKVMKAASEESEAIIRTLLH